MYLDEVSPDSPSDDIAARRVRTFVGSISCDRLKEDSSLRCLYRWDPLKDFIGAVLGKPRLHRFADPLDACSVNVYVDGGELGWHFDASEFSVTLLVQSTETGGAFEYVPGIRGRADEISIVEAVLDGDRRQVRELPVLRPCTGVTRVSGAQPRLVLGRAARTREQRRGADAVLGEGG